LLLFIIAVIIIRCCYFYSLFLILSLFCQEIKALQTEIEQLGEQGEVEKAEEANKKVCPNPKAQRRALN